MKIKKNLIIVLCGLLAFPCLFGCSHDTPPEETGTGASSAVTTAAVTQPDYGDDLPRNLNFQGEELLILSRTEKADREWGTSDSGKPGTLQRAIYERKEQLEDRLNVNIRTVTAAGDWSSRKTFLATILAEANTPDLVLQNSAIVGTGAIQGFYRDLGSVEYLNLQNAWWPGDQKTACAVCGKVFGVLGDASVTLLEETQCILENADLVTSLGGDKPETAVASGAWTAETLFTLVREAELPRNPDGTSGLKATFAGDAAYDGMIYGAGYKLTDSKDGSIALSPSLSARDFSDWFAFWSDFSRRQDVQTLPPSGTDGFASGNVLFHFGTLSDIHRYLSSAKFKTVILPYPKQNAAQKEYCTICTADATAFSIPANTQKAAMAAAVLEGAGSYGFRVSTPAYLANIAFNPRLDGAVNAANFALLHNTLCFDPARLFAEDSHCANVFRQLNLATDGWDSVYRKNTTLWESGMQRIRDLLN